ncbi:MAG: radical SAM family heme chaperone HemW [Alphaproteobacteria bacterium]|nr:radical SAM family heme chaperone HemW [Alphaproteobacteria bacterium]MBU2118022.1 radical SAM family heme chaperone HemW [Alphaproteobacteria bacterium]MBU2352464.1 radical SAM family heme chaperone HemW [Alphaproteobacteria bacterium]MBU2381683.1 radical SAM family heme chaperone HemW [Alphaproteobacteria bacterium]
MRTEPPDPGPDVALYVHWPFCARICPYCDFNVVRARGNTDRAARLTAAILADLRAQAALTGPRRLASIFLGGGTPSLMDAADVAAVVAAARALFPGGPVEVTLEANPTDAEADRFAAFAAAGVNRLSMGVQALDDAQLAFLGRNHSADEARRAVAVAARAFPRLSIDLIHALPGQSVADWRAALTQALDLGFEHVSPYQLTIAQGTAFARAVGRGDWSPPDEDLAAALYEATQATLGAAGFDAYEVSNHARGVDARSAHNLHVWRGGDYLGLGPGAHGRLTRDGVRTATVAHRKIDAYVAGVEAGAPWEEHTALSPQEAAEERVLLGLRTVEGVALSDLDTLPAAARPLAEMVEEGFLIVANGRVIASATGRPLLDAVTRRLLTA